MMTEKLCSGGTYNLRLDLALSDQYGSVHSVKLYAPPLPLVGIFGVWKLAKTFYRCSSITLSQIQYFSVFI